MIGGRSRLSRMLMRPILFDPLDEVEGNWSREQLLERQPAASGGGCDRVCVALSAYQHGCGYRCCVCGGSGLRARAVLGCYCGAGSRRVQEAVQGKVAIYRDQRGLIFCLFWWWRRRRIAGMRPLAGRRQSADRGYRIALRAFREALESFLAAGGLSGSPGVRISRCGGRALL